MSTLKDFDFSSYNKLFNDKFLNNKIGHWEYDRALYITNLLECANMFDKAGIKFLLAFGTLLGAIRDGGPIEGDQDADLALFEPDENKVVDLLNDSSLIKSHGFEIGRVLRDLFSFTRQKTYIDMYMFRPVDKDWRCSIYTLEGFRIEHPWTMPLHGRNWLIPAQPESYFERVYGPDWRTPIKNRHAKQ